jgi:hypothetical protein
MCPKGVGEVVEGRGGGDEGAGSSSAVVAVVRRGIEDREGPQSD